MLIDLILINIYLVNAASGQAGASSEFCSKNELSEDQFVYLVSGQSEVCVKDEIELMKGEDQNRFGNGDTEKEEMLKKKRVAQGVEDKYPGAFDYIHWSEELPQPEKSPRTGKKGPNRYKDIYWSEDDSESEHLPRHQENKPAQTKTSAKPLPAPISSKSQNGQPNQATQKPAASSSGVVTTIRDRILTIYPTVGAPRLVNVAEKQSMPLGMPIFALLLSIAFFI